MSQSGVETKKKFLLAPLAALFSTPFSKLWYRRYINFVTDLQLAPVPTIPRPPPTFRTKSTPLLRWETNHWWNVLSASQGMSWLEFQCQEYLLSTPTPGIQCSGMVVELGSVANSCTNIITCGLWKHYFGVLGGTREPCPKATGQCSALLW